MQYDNTQDDINQNQFKLGQHVKIDMGHRYCILSCSKHRLSDLVETVESLSGKGWEIIPGLTSDDGLVFQSMLKHLKNPKKKERSLK